MCLFTIVVKCKCVVLSLQENCEVPNYDFATSLYYDIESQVRPTAGMHRLDEFLIPLILLAGVR